MDTFVSQMTKEELIEVIELVIDQKLEDFFEKLMDGELKPEVEARLLAQKKLVQQGERGVSLDLLMEDIGLESI